MTQAIGSLTALLLALATSSAADYATEVKALGGAAVHDTIASADSCEVSRVRDVRLVDALDHSVSAGPATPSAEQKHIITQTVGRAALRGHRPDHPADATHLVRFTRGRRVVDVFVSGHDGSFRVVYRGQIVATLGETTDAAWWNDLLNGVVDRPRAAEAGP